MSDIIRPFYIYRFKVPPRINSSKEYIDVIAYDIEDCKRELHRGTLCTPLISRQIKNVYNCTETVESNFSYALIELTKLSFEDLMQIYKTWIKLESYSALYIEQLLELMLFNWDEWN